MLLADARVVSIELTGYAVLPRLSSVPQHSLSRAPRSWLSRRDTLLSVEHCSRRKSQMMAGGRDTENGGTNADWNTITWL